MSDAGINAVGRKARVCWFHCVRRAHLVGQFFCDPALSRVIEFGALLNQKIVFVIDHSFCFATLRYTVRGVKREGEARERERRVNAVVLPTILPCRSFVRHPLKYEIMTAAFLTVVIVRTYLYQLKFYAGGMNG